MYRNRIELYKKLEEKRQTNILLYVTGDRRGLETQIHPEVLNFFINHLDKIGSVERISLFLYTTGGQTLAAWSIANLIRQFCDNFEVIIPSKAHSAGTLISLGANTIVMTKQATLGPIDPTVNTPLNPQIPGAPANARFPVSVEAINGFIELAKSELKIQDGNDLSEVLSILATHIHPLVLGQVYRTRSQIRMLGKRLLQKHTSDVEKIERILSFLCSESGSHDYTIYRQEARDELGLNVQRPDDTEYGLIKAIYDDFVEELELNSPFDSSVLLKEQDSIDYDLRRALVESTNAGSNRFGSEGRLSRQKIIDKASGTPQETIQDFRTFEGWRHDPLS